MKTAVRLYIQKLVSTGVVAAFVYASTDAVVLAAEAAAEHGEEGSSGLPQLDPANFTSQIFWMLLVFFLLYQYLRKRILPRYAEVLEEREEKITGDLGMAEQLRSEAEAAQTAYEASLADARKSAHETIVKAQDKAAADMAAKIAKVESTIKGRFTKTENKIAEQQQAVFAELGSIVSEAVHDSVERIANLKPADADIEKAVKQALEARS